MGNPRYANGALRRKYRARFRAMGCPCGICQGRLGPIHYDEPSDAQHPLSFVIDEIRPNTRSSVFGYDSPPVRRRGLEQSAAGALLVQRAEKQSYRGCPGGVGKKSFYSRRPLVTPGGGPLPRGTGDLGGRQRRFTHREILKGVCPWRR